MPPNLVLDIGLNNGNDAAYYLHLGHRVVGVEANPVLAAQCSQRFEREIAEGRMTVVNAGVMNNTGEFTFYCCVHDDGWSTFTPAMNRNPDEWREMKINCVTTLQLISEYGRPYFIKVDIEGADFQVLETLTAATAPAYISLELNSHDPFIDRLIALGYTAFKFVDGDTFHPAPPIFDHQTGWRLLRKAGRAIPLLNRAMRGLPQALRPKSEWDSPGKYSPDGYTFGAHTSGPLGEQAAGAWLAPERARGFCQKLKYDYAQAGRAHCLWWDVHARHSSAESLDAASNGG